MRYYVLLANTIQCLAILINYNSVLLTTLNPLGYNLTIRRIRRQLQRSRQIGKKDRV
jgi:hypothetical protein